MATSVFYYHDHDRSRYKTSEGLDVSTPSDKMATSVFYHHDHQRSRYKTSKSSDVSTPSEILSRGTEALKAFNEALKEGETEVKQGRTIFVGLERVGKTSTINSLLRKNFDPKQEITDAIATTKLVCTTDAADETMLEEKSQDTSYDLYENAVTDEIMKVLESKRLREASTAAASNSDIGETSIKPLLESKPQRKYKVEVATSTSTSTAAASNSDIEPVLLLESEPQREYKVEVAKKSNQGSKQEEKRKHKDTSKRTKQEKKTEMPKNIQKTLEEKLKKREEIMFQKEGDSKVTSKEFVMNIWDFGGQPIYHVMQRIFMVSFAVVCVVFNLCDDLDAPAKVLNPTTGEVYDHRMTNLEFILHWIQSAYTNSRPDAKTNDGQPSPPIFLIGTHFNSLKGTEEEKKQRVAQIKDQIWQALAGKPFAALVRSTIFTIENSLPFSRSNACDIIEEILDLSRKMIHILPIKWLQVQQEIQELKKKHIYLPTKQIFDLVVSLEVIHDQGVLLQYLHDIGEILYYPDDKALKDIVVLNLMLLVDMFKTVITVEDPKLQTAALRDAWIKLNTGILEEHLLRHLWEKEEFCNSSDDKTFNFFVSLMEKFGLLCEKKHTKNKGRIFYVLSRLKPEASAPPKYDRERAVSLFHDFGSYLPDNLFQRAATKFVEKFQMDNYEPQLSFEHVQLNIDGHHQVILYVATIRQRRMLQTTIVRTKILNVKSAEDKPEPSVCKKVLSFLQTELEVFSQSNARGLKAKMYIPCVCRPNIENAHLHIISKFDQAVLPCEGNAMDVTNYCRFFADSVVPQGFVDDFTIQRVCDEMDDNWKQFGVCLGISYTVTKEFGNEKFEATEKMMHHWKKETTSSNQLAVLHRALTEHGLTNLADWLFGETKADGFKDQDLLFICKHLGSEWRRLAVRLGIKWIDIDKITDTNIKVSMMDALMDALVSWRDGCANQIPTMIKALRQQELNPLACDLRRRHAYKEDTSFEEVTVFQDQSKNGCLTDLHLLTISGMMDENWMEFCSRLAIPRHILVQNEGKYPKAIVDATMHSLVQWRDKQNDDVNQWQTVKEVLKKVGRTDIVDSLEARKDMC